MTREEAKAWWQAHGILSDIRALMESMPPIGCLINETIIKQRLEKIHDKFATHLNADKWRDYADKGFADGVAHMVTPTRRSL